jgi:hypothetical protein
MDSFNDRFEERYGWIDTYGKNLRKARRFEMKSKTIQKPNHIVETFEPKQVWRPFKLINEKRGLAYTILEEMSWSKIARDILKDGTNPSNLSSLVRGQRKSINGWRCEFFD